MKREASRKRLSARISCLAIVAFNYAIQGQAHTRGAERLGSARTMINQRNKRGENRNGKDRISGDLSSRNPSTSRTRCANFAGLFLQTASQSCLRDGYLSRRVRP